ncbi:MAG: ABC transporter permease subunit [Synechococcales cyanobacterium]
MKGLWTVVAIGVAGLLLLPLVPIALWSVAQGWYFPQPWPQQWTSSGWQAVLMGRSGIGRGLLTSGLIAVATTVLSLGVGIPASYVLGRSLVAGVRMVRGLLLLPLLASPLAVVLGIQEVLIRSGLQGSLLGVVLVHLIPTVPYTTLILSGLVAQIDPGYEAQARLLGANPWQVWREVLLPLLAPGLAVSGCLAFLLSWNEFLLTFFVGAGEVLTLPMVLFTLLQGGNYTLIGAVTMTALLPGVILVAVSSRVLKQGIPLINF